jgi:hypothetical protein
MRRSLFGAVAVAVVALTAVLIGTASAAKPPPAPGNSACPTSKKNLKEALNVGASYDAGTYSVESFGPAAQTSLVKYCVYADVAPTALDATAEGADGSDWTASKPDKTTFSFSRPGGEPTNLGLDGSKQEVGKATFGTEPTKNDIVLHISDGGQCFDIYGVVTPTCFVTPGEPVCDAGTGNTDAAYNAIPTDVEHCSPPSLGFEANKVAEFGDRVTLDTTGGAKLLSMTVDFQSYGCETSGHWNTGNCVTPALAGTFTVPGGITATIYHPSDPNTPIASATINPNIPFRPTADVLDTDCPNPPGDPGAAPNSRFKDPVSGQCNYSLSVPLTFTFPAGTTFTNGQDVVWTVQFNTTHYGYNPIGEAPTCFQDVKNDPNEPGCGYDSLNVGAKSYDGAPYAGTDVNDDVAYISWGANSNVLGSDPGWTLYRPLGQIVTGP